MATFVTSPPAISDKQVANIWKRSKGTVCNETAHKTEESYKMSISTKMAISDFSYFVILNPK